MRWLITGGCGFIGSSLVRALKAKGEKDIRIVDNLSVGKRTDLATAGDFRELGPANLNAKGPKGSELMVGDMRDELPAKLGWQAQTGLDAGLVKTVDWFLRQRDLSQAH